MFGQQAFLTCIAGEGPPSQYLREGIPKCSLLCVNICPTTYHFMPPHRCPREGGMAVSCIEACNKRTPFAQDLSIWLSDALTHDSYLCDARISKGHVLAIKAPVPPIAQKVATCLHACCPYKHPWSWSMRAQNDQSTTWRWRAPRAGDQAGKQGDGHLCSMLLRCYIAVQGRYSKNQHRSCCLAA